MSSEKCDGSLRLISWCITNCVPCYAKWCVGKKWLHGCGWIIITLRRGCREAVVGCSSARLKLWCRAASGKPGDFWNAIRLEANPNVGGQPSKFPAYTIYVPCATWRWNLVLPQRDVIVIYMLLTLDHKNKHTTTKLTLYSIH
jgi:hypothetical protein